MPKEKPFYRRHIIGWILSGIVLITGKLSLVVYNLYRAPIEAQIATKQVEDSMTSWVIFHNMAYGEAITNIVAIICFILIVLFLIPTIKDFLQILKN